MTIKRLCRGKEFKRFVRWAGIVVIAFLLGFVLGASFILDKMAGYAERFIDIDKEMIKNMIIQYMGRFP